MAQAGTTPPTPASVIEPVLVTGERRRDDPLAVPAQFSTMSSQDIRDLNVTGFDRVGQTIPNVSVDRRFGTGSGPVISMRGQAATSLSFETDQRVSLYLDDVYLGRYGAMSVFMLADLCGMEARRGPQGTVYGRNAMGGVIRLTTCDPGARPGASASQSLGSRHERQTRLALDTGLNQGFSARLALLQDQHDGWTRNSRPGVVTQLAAPFHTIVSGSELGSSDVRALALTARYDNGQGLRIDYRQDRTDTRAVQPAVQLLALYGGAASLYRSSAGPANAEAQLTRQDSVAEEFTGTEHLRVNGRSLSARLRLEPDLQIVYTLSQRRMSEDGGGNDIDGASFNGNLLTQLGIPTLASTPVCYLCSDLMRWQLQTTSELRLQASPGRWTFTSGLFALRETGYANAPVFIGGSFPAGQLKQVGQLSRLVASDYYSGSEIRALNKSISAFADARVKASDALSLSAGLRRTTDDRYVHQLQGLSGPLEASARTSHLDWEATALVQPADGLSTYARLGTAHMGGGVQSGVPFAPEFIRGAELGARLASPDRRLALDLAVFSAQLRHLQQVQFAPGIGTSIFDGGSSSQLGFETELRAAPTKDSDLHASYGNIRTRSALGFMPVHPRQTLYLGGEARLAPLADGSRPSLRLDAAWRDKARIGPCQVRQLATRTGCTGSADAALTEAVALPSRTALTARLSLSDIAITADARARLSLWVRNALNSNKRQYARDMGNGTVVGSFEAPRSIGLEFDIRQ